MSVCVLTGAALGQSPRALLDQYCVGCHNDRLKTGGVSLQKIDAGHPDQNAEVWEKVIHIVRAGLMPPAGLPRPDSETMNRFAATIESGIDQVALAHPNPGRLGLHRLNRTEYANVVRDMLGLEINSKAYLPPDETSNGFDNMTETLNISPALMEGYLRVAARISRDAVGDARVNTQEQTYHLSRSYTQREHVEGTPFGTRGGIAVRHIFPADGEYVFKIAFQMAEQGMLWGETLGPGERVEIAVNGTRVALLDVDPGINDNSPSLATPRIKVKAGPQMVSASFLVKSDAANGDLVEQHQRSIVDLSAGMTPGVTTEPHLKDLAISGPYSVTGAGDTVSRRKIFICHPADAASELPCAKKIVTNLLRQAYRRPVNDEDIEPFLTAYAEGRKEGDFEVGIRTALHAILAFPEFVFRFEYPPPGLPPETNYRIRDFDLASRLSFFLWSSMPDEELIELAAQGKLKDPAVLQEQVKRMIRDPRSEALSKNFAEQWLEVRVVLDARPDVSIYPDFDDNLAQSMLRETQLFFDSIVRENRSILELLTANYTFVNERLARHYGIPNVAGDRFRRVALTDPNRFGLLGQASILTATSTANRTSPVERGKWVLAVLAGANVPLPPPNVPPLKDNVKGKAPQTVREKLEEHRKNEPCISCHKIMDPIGFSLENFDAVGAWRIHDSGVDINPDGQMYDGTRLDGPVTLRQALLARSDVFVRSFTARLLTYALGRRLEYYDMPVVRTIDAEAAGQDNRFEAIVLGIVRSAPFQMSRTGAEK
jgi:cytochrome c551/c552